MATAGVKRPVDAATRLIDEFGQLPQVLSAPSALLARTARDDRIVDAITAFRETMAYTLRVKLEQRPLLENSRDLNDYLQFTMGGKTIEVFRVLYLTARNHLIRDEVVATGTLDQAAVYVREILHRAFELGAANLILVHNHPSGSKEPSSSDVRLTKRLIEIAHSLNLCVLDHIVVGRGEVSSMRRAGLL